MHNFSADGAALVIIVSLLAEFGQAIRAANDQGEAASNPFIAHKKQPKR